MKKMNLSSLFFLLAFVLVAFNTYSYKKAITYSLNPGRLGDHLLTYAKAKWISWYNQIPLLYKPFEYSNQLNLHLYETKISEKKINSFSKKLCIYKQKDLTLPVNENILYISNQKFISQEFKGFNHFYRYVVQNNGFATEIKKMISPINDLNIEKIPHGVISVAVHVRKGGGVDHPLLSDQYYGQNKKTIKGKYFADQQYPQRFPPEQYYINQLQWLSVFFNNQQLFVHIFTDDPSPYRMVKRFKIALQGYNITFSCRKKGNKHNSNVLQDLFSMTQFDCLIRPASSYSKVAQLLGQHKIIIYPQKLEWHGSMLQVTKVNIIQRDGNEIKQMSEQQKLN